MREIKFRGLEVSTGSWVVGSHVKTGADLHYIVPQNVIGSYMPEYHVKKETVGQFTGLHDKNGKEIYEGDVLKGTAYGYGKPKRHIGVVEYRYAEYKVCGVKQYKGLNDELSTIYEVIGNAYENPELLEQTS